MHNLGKSIAATLVALAYGCSVVSAATVTGPSGAVLVNIGGSGFVKAGPSAEVPPGGQVMVNPNHMAVIAYPDGCTVQVHPGRVWTIQPTSPCVSGNKHIDLAYRMNQSADPQQSNPIVNPDTNNALLIGSMVAGVSLVVACLAVWCHKPASP